MEIGRARRPAGQYDGGLDEVRLWNVARTASAIQATMNTELAGTEAGLVAYWRFNEGLGTSVADDSPGNPRPTLLAGTAWVADGPLAPDTTAPQITERGRVERHVVGRHDHIHDRRSRRPAGSPTSPARRARAPTSSARERHDAHHHADGLTPDTLYQFVVQARDSGEQPAGDRAADVPDAGAPARHTAAGGARS